MQAQLGKSDIQGAKETPVTKDEDSEAAGAAGATSAKCADTADKHHTLLLSLVAEQLGCSPTDIVDFELNVCDVQPGVLGGAQDEFVFVGRLDNLASCYTSLEASGWEAAST